MDLAIEGFREHSKNRSPFVRHFDELLVSVDFRGFIFRQHIVNEVAILVHFFHRSRLSGIERSIGVSEEIFGVGVIMDEVEVEVIVHEEDVIGLLLDLGLILLLTSFYWLT